MASYEPLVEICFMSENYWRFLKMKIQFWPWKWSWKDGEGVKKNNVFKNLILLASCPNYLAVQAKITGWLTWKMYQKIRKWANVIKNGRKIWIVHNRVWIPKKSHRIFPSQFGTIKFEKTSYSITVKSVQKYTLPGPIFMNFSRFISILQMSSHTALII